MLRTPLETLVDGRLVTIGSAEILAGELQNFQINRVVGNGTVRLIVKIKEHGVEIYKEMGLLKIYRSEPEFWERVD